MAELTTAEIQLISLGITVAVQEIPKVIRFFKSLNSPWATMTAQQIADTLAQSDGVDEGILKKAYAALEEQGVTL